MNVLALLLFVVAAVSAKDDCTDEHELCSFWAAQFDQCNQNAVWMKPNCPASCGKCTGEKKVVIKKCNDEDELCAKFAANGECEKSPDYMFWKCQKACKFCAGEGPQPYPKAMQARGGRRGGKSHSHSHSHEKKEHGGEMKHREAGGATDCTDNNDLCPFWKSLGECTANPNYMLRSCKASCSDCSPKKIKIEKCASEDANCDAWKAAGECDKPGPFYMFWKCEKTCGFCSRDGEVVDYPKGLLNAAQPANGQLVQPTAGGASSTAAPQTVPTQPAATLPPVANLVQSQAATVTVPAVVQTQPPTPGSSQPPVVLVTQPAPVATQPAPVATQPAPVATQPAPVATQPPAPATTLPPAPVVTTQSVPAPIATQPAAVVTQQAPAVQTTQSQTAAPTTQSQPTTAAAVVTTTAAAAPTTQSVPIVLATAPASTQAPAASQAPAVVATAGSSQAPAVQATTVQFSTDIKQSVAASAGGCTDKHRLCAFWKSIGECNANPSWMVPNCAASCKSCTPSRVFIDTCADTDPNCAAFGTQGECSKQFVFYMFWKCPKTCNFCTADKTEIDYPAALLNAPAGTTAPKILHHL